MKRSHKIVSLLLVLALCLGLGVTAYAQDNYDDLVSPAAVTSAWSVYHYSATSTGEVTCNSSSAIIHAEINQNSFTTNCTYYYSQNDASGDVAYAKVTFNGQDSDGNEIFEDFSYNHKQVNTSGRTYNFTIEKGSTIKGSYAAQGATSVYFRLNGSLFF